MITNVSTLLRKFPKIRRAALSGEKVVVRTREGDLLISAAPTSKTPLLGSLQGVCTFFDDNLDKPTLPEEEWDLEL